MHRVLHAFADPFAFRQALPDIWSGFLINVHMMVIAEALVLVLALLIAIVRGLPGRGTKPLRGLAILYTDFFRGTPLTIVAYACILGLPGLGYGLLRRGGVLRLPDDPAGALHRPHHPRARKTRARGRRMSGPNGHFVSVQKVTKRFGDLEVLKQVDLDVSEHKVVCLIGASGSGKSTLLRCINLLEKVDEGTIVVDGLPITEGKVDVNALRRKIGIAFQADNLFPHMTA